MKKVFIVLLFILLGSSLIVLNNMDGGTENSFIVVYENNKNLALPDLTDKTEIIDGIYRYYDNNGIVIDYNTYNGVWNVNGQSINASSTMLMFDLLSNQEYTSTYMYVSGSINNQIQFFYRSSLTGYLNRNGSNYQNDLSITTTLTTQNQYVLYATSSVIFNNFEFRLQIEKGSQATSYVVPKLIPHYQDNLSMEDKQKIGLGAFGGITKIIKTIDNIIQPVNNFIDGILSWFK